MQRLTRERLPDRVFGITGRGHEGRISTIERLLGKSGGDYVFLQETTIDSAANPLMFDAIDQGYQHLVLELLLQTDPGAPSDTAQIVANDYFGVDWSQIDSRASASGPREFKGSDDSGVGFHQAIPVTTALAPVFAMITVKFLYYATDVVKGCTWQGVSYYNIADDTSEDVLYAAGGGLFTYDAEVSNSLVDPITNIKIDCGFGNLWAPSTRGQLYGIKNGAG